MSELNSSVGVWAIRELVVGVGKHPGLSKKSLAIPILKSIPWEGLLQIHWGKIRGKKITFKLFH